jgi:hypothetical protein
MATLPSALSLGRSAAENVRGGHCGTRLGAEPARDELRNDLVAPVTREPGIHGERDSRLHGGRAPRLRGRSVPARTRSRRASGAGRAVRPARARPRSDPQPRPPCGGRGARCGATAPCRPVVNTSASGRTRARLRCACRVRWRRARAVVRAGAAPWRPMRRSSAPQHSSRAHRSRGDSRRRGSRFENAAARATRG